MCFDGSRERSRVILCVLICCGLGDSLVCTVRICIVSGACVFVSLLAAVTIICLVCLSLLAVGLVELLYLRHSGSLGGYSTITCL